MVTKALYTALTEHLFDQVAEVDRCELDYKQLAQPNEDYPVQDGHVLFAFGDTEYEEPYGKKQLATTELKVSCCTENSHDTEHDRAESATYNNTSGLATFDFAASVAKALSNITPSASLRTVTLKRSGELQKNGALRWIELEFTIGHCFSLS